MNMNYSRWVNEVRRQLIRSGEPSPELLVAKAERDLPGMYMAGETASGAAARLHRYRANPGGGGLILGLVAALGIGWLLLRPKKAEAKPKIKLEYQTPIQYTSGNYGESGWQYPYVRDVFENGSQISHIQFDLMIPHAISGSPHTAPYWKNEAPGPAYEVVWPPALPNGMP